MMGYNLPPTQADIDAEIKNRMNGEPPELTEEQKQRQYIANLLNEAHNREPSADEYWKAPDFAQKTKPYYDALNKLKEQLTGKRPLSVKDAYYEIEAAYGNIFLSKKEYDEEIKKSVDFIRRWMMENKLNMQDNLALNFAIQKFMTDTLSIGKHSLELPNIIFQTHLPFYYDYQDYKAERDYRSYHLTKTLATGNGQCHTLPLTYATLAEALGAKFYLSFAPIHDFIKYPDNAGNIHNFEVTSNWQISDQWYKDNMYVNSIAEKNKIYLNMMDRKQIVAEAMIDLACSYRQKFGIADGKFITECVDYAMTYFPNKESNIYGWLIRSKITAVNLDRLLMKKEVKAVSEAEQIPEAKELLNKMNAINKKIESLGYKEIPDEAYDFMVQNQDNKGKIQQLKQLNNLQKRNLFIPLNPK